MDHQVTEVLYCAKVPVVVKQAVAASVRLQATAGASVRPHSHKSATHNARVCGQDSTGAEKLLNKENVGPLDEPENGLRPRFARDSSPSRSKVLQEHQNPGLRVQISQTTLGPSRQRVLNFEITDDEDPYFLCELEIAEEDYSVLKQEQNLLVDFQQFPVKVVELLDQCIRCQSREPRSPLRNSVQSPKHALLQNSGTSYVAQLLRDDSKRFVTLDILETNSFKQMSHLSLDFVPGNDASVKQYLARLVQSGKQEIVTLKGQLEYTSETLSNRVNELQTQLTRVNSELERVRLSHSEKTGYAQMQHASELAQVQERCNRDKEILRQELEKKERSTESRYEKEVQELTLKNTHLTTTHSHLLALNQTLEANLSNVKGRLEDIEKDFSSLKTEHEKVVAENRSLNRTKQEAEKTLEEVRSRVSVLDGDLRSLTNEKRALDETLKLELVKRKRAEDALSLQESKAQALEETLMTTRSDINKANDIIRRLQTDVKESKEKSRLKNTIAYQQEVLLEERAQIIQDYKSEIEQMKKTLQTSAEERDSAAKELEEVRSKLASSQQVIQDNNNVIEWLHKQLNQSASLAFPLRANRGLATSSAADVVTKYTTRSLDSDDPSPASKYLSGGASIVPVVAHPFQSGLAAAGKLGNTAADILAYRRRPTSPNRPSPASASSSFLASKVAHASARDASIKLDTTISQASNNSSAVTSNYSQAEKSFGSESRQGANISGVSAPGKKYGITFGEPSKRSAASHVSEAVQGNRAVASKSNYF